MSKNDLEARRFHVWDSLHKERKIPTIGWFMPSLPISRNSKILDIGCGEGVQLSWVCDKYGAQGWGIDISPYAIELSSRFANIKTELGDARHIPFPDDNFDFVYALGLFEHFENAEPLFQEVSRVLKQGGSILVTVPNKLSLWTIALRPLLKLTGHFEIGYERSFTTKELGVLLDKTGFHLARFYKAPFQILGGDTIPRVVMKRLENCLGQVIPPWSFFLGGLAVKK